MDLIGCYLSLTNQPITLQENNAIATVDLVKGEIIDIYPLGSKAWEGLKMDISDKDGGELTEF